jgi:hypothetical protein
MKRMIVFIAAVAVMFTLSHVSAYAETSKPFSGAKVNGGTVTYSKEGNNRVLTLSNDFQQKIDTPDPHWQVVDSKGNAYLLQRFEIKDMKMHRKIMLPAYVPDVAKVQFWCAFAEVNLGEAAFDKHVK